MTHRGSSRPHRSVSASRLVEEVAATLSAIKEQDGLSDADLGAEIGKGEDSARAYRTGFSTMDMVTFLRGCQRWNGRFANDVLALIGMRLAAIEDTRNAVSDRAKESAVLKAALALSIALADDDLSDEDIRKNRGSLENARDAIDALLSRIGPKAGAA
jgi:hypothetical protein